MMWGDLECVAESLFESGHTRIEVYKLLLGEFEGTPYLWGGCTTKGSDCSGSVCAAFSKAIGTDIRVTANDLYRFYFTHTVDSLHDNEDEIMAVFFLDSRGKAVHVAGYKGNDVFINVSSIELGRRGNERSLHELAMMYDEYELVLRVLPWPKEHLGRIEKEAV